MKTMPADSPHHDDMVNEKMYHTADSKDDDKVEDLKVNSTSDNPMSEVENYP